MAQECKTSVSAQVKQVTERKWKEQQRLNQQSFTTADIRFFPDQTVDSK